MKLFLQAQDEVEIAHDTKNQEQELIHNANQLSLEAAHFQQQAELETEFNDNEINTGTTFIAASFIRSKFVPTPFVLTPYSKSPAVSSLKLENGTEFKIVDGVYIKVLNPRMDELILNVSQAQVAVQTGISKCPELSSIEQQLSDSNKLWNVDMEHEDANRRTITNVIFNSLSPQSKEAMATHVVGGTATLDGWHDSMNFLALIDALYVTHQPDECYIQMSNSEKEAFRRQQADFLSEKNLRQSNNETIITYCSRMHGRFDLSINDPKRPYRSRLDPQRKNLDPNVSNRN